MRHALAALASIALAAPVLCGCGNEVAVEPQDATPAPFTWPEPGATARLHVRELGTIEVALYPALAPKAVDNFVKLAGEGFYDETSFHRVIPGFMIQGGDPNSKDKDPSDDGRGGPGYRLADEFSRAPHERGVVSMANLGLPNTGGSQFFIVHRDSPHLDGKYTVFGRVLAGLDVVDRIAAVETDLYGRWGPKNRPIERIIIDEVEILPSDLSQGVPRRSATPTEGAAAPEPDAKS
jgi:peptidyl-prolyl cis-trans isomerase B (cyclophilin B)